MKAGLSDFCYAKALAAVLAAARVAPETGGLDSHVSTWESFESRRDQRESQTKARGPQTFPRTQERRDDLQDPVSNR